MVDLGMSSMYPQWASMPSRAERDLRRHIDLSLSRALCDREYAESLLADPTLVVAQQGCTPQQFLDLREINARSIQEFASQAEALFWPAAEPAGQPEGVSLLAAGRR